MHSLDGKGRCIACVAAYLMFRHRWGFEKVLDFLCNKRPDAAPNASFVQQVMGDESHDVEIFRDCSKERFSQVLLVRHGIQELCYCYML